MSCQNAVEILKAQQFIQLGDENFAYWIDGNEMQLLSNLSVKLYLPLAENQTIDKVVLVVGSSLIETRYFRTKPGLLPSYLLFQRINLAFARSLNLLVGVTDGKTYTVYAKTLSQDEIKANRLANWRMPHKEIIFSAKSLQKDVIFTSYRLPNMVVEIAHSRECAKQSFLLPKVTLNSTSNDRDFLVSVDLSALPTSFLGAVKTVFITDPVGQILGYVRPHIEQLQGPISIGATSIQQFEDDFNRPLIRQPKIQECPFLRVLVDMDFCGSLMTRLSLH